MASESQKRDPSVWLLRCLMMGVLVAIGALSVLAIAGPASAEEHNSPTMGFSPPTGEVPSTTVPTGAVPLPPGYDEAADAAQDAADFASPRGQRAVPAPVELPPVKVGDGSTDPDRHALPPHLPPAESSLGEDDFVTLAGCVGNCYQSDRALLHGDPNDVYNVDYLYWMQTPQNNETNKCDSSSNSSACFWFTMQLSWMDCCNSAMHIGPQRGDSLAGSAGGNWRMNIDGYNDGVHIGGQSSTNLPIGTWVRVRTWQIDKGANWSKWGVWARWDGTDHYLGSLTIDGVYITGSMLAVELYEANNQCSTDFVGVYLDNPRFRSVSQGLRAYSSATADYEANCSNTSWKVISPPDYIHDVREATRVIPDGGTIWD